MENNGTPDEDARKAEAIRAAMRADLGGGRCEDLPMDDGERDRRRGRGGPPMSRPLPPPRRAGPLPTANTIALSAWKVAVAKGVFDDDDAVGVKDLDHMAGGRLHAINRGDHPAQPGLSQALLDRTTRALNQRLGSHEFPPWSKRGRYENTVGQGHQGSGPIPGVKPTRNYPLAENIKAKVAEDWKQALTKAPAAPPAAPPVKIQAPKNVKLHLAVFVRMPGKAGLGHVFLCGTVVPIEACFIVYIGAEQTASLHPVQLTDYMSTSTALMLTFVEGLKINIEFKNTSEVKQFWELFRKLNDAGDGGGKPQDLGVKAPIQPKAQPSAPIKTSGELPEVPKTSKPHATAVPAPSPATAVATGPVVVPAGAPAVAPNLLAFNSPAVSANGRSAPHRAAAVNSIDLLGDDLANLRLSDHSSPPMNEATELPLSPDPSPLINLGQPEDGETEQPVRRRILSSSYDEELSVIQPSPPADSPEPTPAASSIANHQSPAVNGAVAVLNDDPALAHLLGESLMSLMKCLNVTYKGDRAAISGFVHRYLEQVLSVDAPQAGDTPRQPLPAKSPQQLSELPPVQVPNNQRVIQQELSDVTPLKFPAAQVEVKQETPNSEVWADKINNLLRPESRQAQRNGTPMLTSMYSANQLMDLRTPTEIPGNVHARIQTLKLSPSVQAVKPKNREVPAQPAATKSAAPAPLQASGVQAQQVLKNGTLQSTLVDVASPLQPTVKIETPSAHHQGQQILNNSTAKFADMLAQSTVRKVETPTASRQVQPAVMNGTARPALVEITPQPTVKKTEAPAALHEAQQGVKNGTPRKLLVELPPQPALKKVETPTAPQEPRKTSAVQIKTPAGIPVDTSNKMVPTPKDYVFPSPAVPAPKPTPGTAKGGGLASSRWA